MRIGFYQKEIELDGIQTIHVRIKIMQDRKKSRKSGRDQNSDCSDQNKNYADQKKTEAPQRRRPNRKLNGSNSIIRN